VNNQLFDNRAFEVLFHLQDSSYNSWFVGGCVRDALCGKKFTDYDLATIATPTEIIKIFENYEIDKKSLNFGCVRVNNAGLWLEITTLRQDVNPDGRYTQVAFTNDLEKDASRRDFTINALYWDGREGSLIIDFFDGQPDLLVKKVRFIGDAEIKVQEDYLRILRFFRFSAIYGYDLDQTGVGACEKYQQGLAYLSGTRVWGEWSKLLLKSNTEKVLEQIVESEIDLALFGMKLNINRSYLGSDPLLFTKLLLPTIQIPHLVHRLSLSKKESEWLKTAESVTANQDFREFYLEHGDDARELVYYWAAKFLTSSGDELSKPFWKVSNPRFPLIGKDLLKLGCLPGPIMGVYLKSTHYWWIQNDFTPDYEACLLYAGTLLKS
jgi:poly(A) polymerase